jgi:lysophospholipase L1-like esterase
MKILPNLKNWSSVCKVVSFYLVILHLLLITIIFTPNLAAKISKIMGKEHPHNLVIYNYQSMSTMLGRVDRNLDKNTAVFIGDSLTQGMAVNNILPYAVNFGIGHDTIDGVLQRIRTYKSINKMATVIIAVGINDLRKLSVKTAISHYTDLLNELRKLNNVYIHEVLPIDQNILGNKLQNKITLFNQQLFNVTKEFDTVHFLRKSNKFIDSNGSLKASLHLGDGLHLNKAGYDIWINQLKEQLKINE